MPPKEEKDAALLRIKDRPQVLILNLEVPEITSLHYLHCCLSLSTDAGTLCYSNGLRGLSCKEGERNRVPAPIDSHVNSSSPNATQIAELKVSTHLYTSLDSVCSISVPLCCLHHKFLQQLYIFQHPPHKSSPIFNSVIGQMLYYSTLACSNGFA